jgi:2Fe-2S ferredoxin
MTKIIYVEFDGTEHPIEAADGTSVMQNALNNSVPGILGDCGGCCSCATCHGYVDPQYLDKIAPKSDLETVLLDGALDTQPNSRLTCQINVEPALEGLVVRLPKSQL